MTEHEALTLIDEITDAKEAARLVFLAITTFSDWEMADGDSARAVAQAWLDKFGSLKD